MGVIRTEGDVKHPGGMATQRAGQIGVLSARGQGTHKEGVNVHFPPQLRGLEGKGTRGRVGTGETRVTDRSRVQVPTVRDGSRDS